MQYLSSLKQFGLLIEEGSGEARKFRLTDRALDLLTYDHSHGNWIRAVKDAALEPKIHRELWDKYSGKLPREDVSIRVYLIREREDGLFNKDHVDGFIAQFRATIAFSGLVPDDKIGQVPEGESGEDERETPPTEKPKPGDMVWWKGPGDFLSPNLYAVGGMSDDGRWVFLQGVREGVAVSEIKIQQKPKEPVGLPPENPYFGKPDGQSPAGSGQAIDRVTLEEGPAVLTMPDKLGAGSIGEFEYWASGIIQRMRRKTGAHLSRVLPTGEQVHLIHHPDRGWFVNSYEWSWLTDHGQMLTTAQVFAQRLGWDTIEFETPDDAIKFVQEKINEGVVPHKPKREAPGR